MNIPLHAMSWAYVKQIDYQIGQGFPTDVLVDENVEDIIIGKDAIMQVALEKINGL